MVSTEFAFIKSKIRPIKSKALASMVRARFVFAFLFILPDGAKCFAMFDLSFCLRYLGLIKLAKANFERNGYLIEIIFTLSRARGEYNQAIAVLIYRYTKVKYKRFILLILVK